MPIPNRSTSTCGICNKTFSSQHFKRHMQIHLKEANETSICYCKICNYAFTAEVLSKHKCDLFTPVPPEVLEQSFIRLTSKTDSKNDDVPFTNACSGPLKNKAQLMQNKMKEAATLNNEELKLITQPEKISLLEHKQKELNICPLLETLKPWQQSVLDILTEKNFNNRTIHVLVDKIGGKGKTVLRKHCDNMPNFLTIPGSSKTNLFVAYNKLINNLNNPFWNVIIDLPRSTNFLPSFIEEIKDNNFPSWNYTNPALKISNNNIFVFLNNEDLLQALSIDRIKLYIINDNNELEMEQYIPPTQTCKYCKSPYKKYKRSYM